MNATDALARLAAFGLPGASVGPISCDSLEDLAQLADTRRAVSWVADAVAAGLVGNATPEFVDDLRMRRLAAVQTTMAAHAAALSVVKRLEVTGMSNVRVLKGCATGHLDYSQHVDRFSTDVDLLIPTGEREVLARVFLPGSIPVPRRRRWDERYGRSTTIIDDSGVEIDVHTTISFGYFGLVIPPDELRHHTETFRIGGHEMYAFDGPGRLLHAANHLGGSGHYNLNSVRDVLQLVLISEVDWRDAIDRAERWKVDSLMALGVRRAFAALSIERHPILEWAERHRPVGRQRFALGVASDLPRGHLLTAPLALPVFKWPGYMWPLLFPSRDYFADSGIRWRRRTSRLLREVFRRSA